MYFFIQIKTQLFSCFALYAWPEGVSPSEDAAPVLKQAEKSETSEAPADGADAERSELEALLAESEDIGKSIEGRKKKTSQVVEKVAAKKEAKAEGEEEVSEDPEEIAADMAAEVEDNPAVDPEDVAELGVETETDPDGGIRIDPNTPGYRELPDGTVMGPPGAPYSSGGNVYAGRPNEISPDAGHITYDSLTAFEWNGELSDSQRAQVDNPENIPLIEARFPTEWYDVAIEFCNTEGDVNPDMPIALASCPTLTAIISYPGQPPRIEESPIAIGRNGYGPNVRADEDVRGQSGDGRTQTGRVQHFHNVTIAGPDSLAGGSTMTGAIIRSPEGQDRGGRWWHGGRDGRFPGHNSLGCVVAPDEFMIRLAEAVNRHGGWYGFQSEQARGESTQGRSDTPVA